MSIWLIWPDNYKIGAQHPQLSSSRPPFSEYDLCREVELTVTSSMLTKLKAVINQVFSNPESGGIPAEAVFPQLCESCPTGQRRGDLFKCVQAARDFRKFVEIDRNTDTN